MVRGRSTPYVAQLRRYLRDGDIEIFSAATLEPVFEHAPHTKVETNLAGIHKVLMKAFADGHIVAFVDDDGDPLRESEVVIARSKALAHPRFFGRPGVTSPDPDYHAVTHEDTLRRGISLDGAAKDGNGNVGVDSEETEVEDGMEGAASETEEVADASKDEAPDVEVLKRGEAALKRFPENGSVAPEFIDERLLRRWVSLPEVTKRLAHGLSIAEGVDKFELIGAGVTRKQRSWRSDSTIAGNLATLCGTSSGLWGNVARFAVRHYLAGESGGLMLSEMPELLAEPLEYYERSALPPDVIVLLALAVEVDDADLELIADHAASELGHQQTVDATTALQERIRTLEGETSELRRTAKDAEKNLRAAARRERQMSEQLEALHHAAVQDGVVKAELASKAEKELRARAEHAETHAEQLESERIPELEAELEALEGARERLEAAEAALRDERRLRNQAEQDSERLSARVRVMTDEVSRASDLRNLPAEDAASLLDVLSRPIGQAARHAGERLAAGRPKPHDELLLELAAGVAQMSRRLDAASDVDVELEVKTAAEIPEVADAVQDTAEAPAAEAQVEERALAKQGEVVGEAQAAEQQPQAEPGVQRTRPLRRRSKLKVRPLGGAGEVGGSAILVTNNSGHTVLLDCGQRVRGEYGLDTEPAFHRSIGQEGRLHAILLSHAHVDHVGSLPILHRLQSDAQEHTIPVYMTEPTRRLAEIMLMDSAKIQESRELDPGEVGFLDYGQGTIDATYRRGDVNRVLDDEFVREVNPALAVPIPETSFVARFIPVAHVLGSCAIHLTDTENDQTLLYTGDLGPIGAPQVTLPHYSLADMLPAHLVVMESTYGSRRPEHNDGKKLRRALTPREAAVKRLCQLAGSAYERGGSVLLPAFSLGRTQELAMLIEQARRDGEAPTGDIIVAGMGEKITEVYRLYSKGTNPWARTEAMPYADELGRRLRKHPQLSFDDVVGEVLESGFSYVIASPAMLGSGWSRSFLRNMYDNPAHAVVMSGFVPRDGGHIPRLHRMHKGEMIDLDGQPRRVLCEFEQLKGLSAHAPAVDLHQFAQYVARQGENVAFAMVHGDEAAQLALAEDVAQLPGVASAESLNNGYVWQPQRS